MPRTLKPKKPRPYKSNKIVSEPESRVSKAPAFIDRTKVDAKKPASKKPNSKAGIKDGKYGPKPLKNIWLKGTDKANLSNKDMAKTSKVLSVSSYGEAHPEIASPHTAKIAFIGRSNVGKSSLINYIMGRQIAKISKHPGRTRKHEIYPMDNDRVLVDMPGYGYARISKDRRQIWTVEMQKLFFEDNRFKFLMVLIDSSISPTQIDKDYLQWLADSKVKFGVIFTKIDKATQRELNSNLKGWRDFLDPSIRTFETSTVKHIGKDEIMNLIKQITITNNSL
jgi:GTP-binding protein